MTDTVSPRSWASAPAGAGEHGLPDGWDVAEYAGRGGKSFFAVYAHGRRIASGMTTPQSAMRWARLLATGPFDPFGSAA